MKSKNSSKRDIKENPKSSTSKKQNIHKEPETMDDLMKLLDERISVRRGDTVEGTVISVTNREVLVDLGKKSYGILAEWELEQVRDLAKTLKKGDVITSQVMSPENDSGYVVLSLRKSSSERRWTKLEDAKETGEDIDVSPLETAKGGLLVDWNGLRGFIPSSQLSGANIQNPSALIGQRVSVKVLEVDKALNRLVLSQKASVLGVTPKVLREKLDKIKPEDNLKGVISGVAPFGLFVDIEGLEGLVHISEIAWEKVEDPSIIFKTGEKVEVMVLEVNKNEGKLNLSIKRLTPDPWKNILDRYPLDSSIKGKTMRKASYGYFVQIEPGIEGLIHISKITPGEEPEIGKSINCLIENVDIAKRKISLTLVHTEKPVGYR